VEKGITGSKLQCNQMRSGFKEELYHFRMGLTQISPLENELMAHQFIPWSWILLRAAKEGQRQQ
jgi:hypothetical protein